MVLELSHSRGPLFGVILFQSKCLLAIISMNHKIHAMHRQPLTYGRQSIEADGDLGHLGAIF